ncbi:hypothetical protein RU639_001234 [Aspergillus parasiticus]
MHVKPSQNTVDPPPTLPPQTTQQTIINSWVLVPSVVFPNLHDTICQLASRLATNPDVYLQRLPYHSVITGHGGPQKMAHIQMLLESLLSTQARQNNIWSPKGGYVDIVTDLRNDEHWRAYPGQSKGPTELIKIHNRAVLRGSKSTLHYYVIAQGQGF